MEASFSTASVDIPRGWTLAGTAEAAFQPLFVYPGFRSGVAARGGFRLAHALAEHTSLAITGRASTTYVDDWRPVFEGSAEVSWRECIELRAGLRHDDRLRREGSLADFRDPTGRMFVGVSALPFKKGRFSGGAAIDYERAMPGTGRLPSGTRVTAVARFRGRG